MDLKIFDTYVSLCKKYRTAITWNGLSLFYRAVKG